MEEKATCIFKGIGLREIRGNFHKSQNCEQEKRKKAREGVWVPTKAVSIRTTNENLTRRSNEGSPFFPWKEEGKKKKQNSLRKTSQHTYEL